MNRYGASGPTAATAATADNAVAQIWNPSTTKRLFVKEIHVFKTTAGAADIPNLRRTSARGTITTAYTPDITNDFEHGLAPESVCTIDLNFSVQPTFLGTAARGNVGALLPAAIGAGIMWVFERPMQVKSGQGLCVCTGSALAFPVSIVTFVWDE